ncbi:MAG: hypothetical protein M3271_06430 [Actinomycetota bacterium]|nr:hypothetical protein [Actinomycetota bacterium]
MRRLGRLPVYAGAGFAFEVAFSALHDLARGREVRVRTSPWMPTVYALLLPLYEPVHDRVRDRPLPVRATVYGLGFLAVEYSSGRVFRRLRGEAPWDYTYAKRHVHGLIRPDYFFLWALAGLLCEPLHDRLTR